MSKVIATLAVVGFITLAVMVGVYFTDAGNDTVEITETNYSGIFEIKANEEQSDSRVIIYCDNLIKEYTRKDTSIDYSGISSNWAYECSKIKRGEIDLSGQMKYDLKDMGFEIWSEGICYGDCGVEDD